MIEIRKLNKKEFDNLIENAPYWAKNPVLSLDNPYAFFNKAEENLGIVVDGLPIYMGTLFKVKDIYALWTIIRENPKYHFTIYKTAKRIARKWADKYGKIYSFTDKTLPLQIKWVKKMGFNKEGEDNKDVVLALQKEELYV